MQTHTLNGRVAVVTGASAGIGEAIARGLVVAGAKVVINARREERLRAIAKDLGGASVATAAGDAADPGVIRSMFDRAQSAFASPVDLVVANAGRGLKGSPVDSDPAQWDEMIRTNLTGVAMLLREAAARLTATPTGGKPRDIIVLGSVVGRHVSPYSSMYGATKFAVHALAEGVRRELAPKGVRVSVVEPGFVTSEFQGVAGYDPAWYQGVLQRIGPVLEPADVARVVRFIAEQPAHVHVGDVLVRPVRQDYP